MPNTESADPKRATLLSDKELPRTAKSKRDTDDPRRESPKIENVEPNLATLLRDRDEPKCATSRTEKEEPMRDIPNNE
jgi:hypothetical protein